MQKTTPQNTTNAGAWDGQQKYITINLHKAFSILAAAVLTAFVSGAVAALYTANSDHFRLVALDATVAAIDDTYARKDVVAEQYRAIDQRLGRIEQALIQALQK